MAFKLFKKQCSTCGSEVGKGTGLAVSGLHFCSEAHADQYQKDLDKAQTTSKSGGSCCG